MVDKIILITMMIMCLLSCGCIDANVDGTIIRDQNYPLETYYTGYNDGFENHNVTVLDKSIIYINNDIKMTHTQLGVALFPIEKKISNGYILYVVPYANPLPGEFSMGELSMKAETEYTAYCVGYIVGYTDWYNSNV